MKKLLFLMVCTTLISCGAYTPTQVNIGELSNSFEVEGNKDDLYVKANQWMVERFNSAKSVVQFSDKEAGLVSGRYYLGSTETTDGMHAVQENEVYANLKLQVKENAAKITIQTQPYSYSEGMGIVNTGTFKEEDLKTELNATMADFENYMKNSNATDF